VCLRNRSFGRCTRRTSCRYHSRCWRWHHRTAYQVVPDHPEHRRNQPPAYPSNRNWRCTHHLHLADSHHCMAYRYWPFHQLHQHNRMQDLRMCSSHCIHRYLFRHRHHRMAYPAVQVHRPRRGSRWPAHRRNCSQQCKYHRSLLGRYRCMVCRAMLFHRQPQGNRSIDQRIGRKHCTHHCPCSRCCRYKQNLVPPLHQRFRGNRTRDRHTGNRRCRHHHRCRHCCHYRPFQGGPFLRGVPAQSMA
jgi:hypothetical protein